MPCSCMPGCTCGSAAGCAASACVGSAFAGAHIAGMGALIGGYHTMWYPAARTPGEPTPEDREEIRAMMRERDEELLQKLRAKLTKIESETPGGLLNTAHHLERETEKLQERIRRLEHEISILEG